ncbi:hypothetical protein GC194_04210 [bacterium]|nr:hypothetical protein [bacterium]
MKARRNLSFFAISLFATKNEYLMKMNAITFLKHAAVFGLACMSIGDGGKCGEMGSVFNI